MEDYIDLKLLINAVLFSIIGILVFLGASWLYDKITPFKLWEEIVSKQNTALAIVVGSMMIGLSIIIAFAHG